MATWFTCDVTNTLNSITTTTSPIHISNTRFGVSFYFSGRVAAVRAASIAAAAGLRAAAQAAPAFGQGAWVVEVR